MSLTSSFITTKKANERHPRSLSLSSSAEFSKTSLAQPKQILVLCLVAKMPGEFVGGSLSFKGDKSKTKKKKRRVKHDIVKQQTTKAVHETNNITTNNNNDDEVDDGLTEVERKALRRRLERERLDAERIAQKSHRERIEEFNSKLASQTELNDIPRVSAAGNG